MDPQQQRLDQAAQKMGFPNYAVWQGWNAQRQQSVQPQAPQPGVHPLNFLQGLMSGIQNPHPLAYVANRLNQVLP